MTATSRRGSALTVALPKSLGGLAGNFSAGKMWRQVTAELRELGVRVRFDEPGSRRFGRRRADVWLTDGHLGAIDISGPVVAHLHEAPWQEPPSDHSLDPEFRKAGQMAADASTRQATLIITPSEFSRDQVMKAHSVPADRVRVVPHGVDVDVFNPSGQTRGEQVMNDSRVPMPYVLFVSVLHPRKNLPALRSAMAILAREGLPHSLVMVVSPAADRQDYEALVAAARAPLPGLEGRVAVMQRLTDTDLAGVMAAAAALCAPSLSEGFGLTPLEAMACGTPVVVSNRGALPEVVGDAGLLVEPDPEAIAAGLRQVLGDPARAQQLVAAGLARSRPMSWRASARQWLDVLEEAAGR